MKNHENAEQESVCPSIFQSQGRSIFSVTASLPAGASQILGASPAVHGEATEATKGDMPLDARNLGVKWLTGTNWTVANASEVCGCPKFYPKCYLHLCIFEAVLAY